MHGDPLGGVAKAGPVRLCSIDDCGQQARRQGWCGTHFKRWARYGDPLTMRRAAPVRDHPETCSVEGCDRLYYARGWCSRHYSRWLYKGDPLVMSRNAPGQMSPCRVDGCTRHSKSFGWCDLHYRRWLRTGDPTKILRREAGSGSVKRNGYMAICVDGKQRLEHRVVMEGLLGRPLRPDGTVHHRNGRRDDNRPENLELWSSSHPSGQRVEEKVRWAREILRLYGDLLDLMAA
jgi:hypothetical protein